MPDLSKYQNTANQANLQFNSWNNVNPVVSRILNNPQALRVPDFSKYQNMANQMNTQFNNLPSPSTVYQDHFIYNDVGRSFRQPQIYQPPTISIPRFEPIQMPGYEPIHIPQVPIPVYQPPAMPNF